jgi:hypothetical protein
VLKNLRDTVMTRRQLPQEKEHGEGRLDGLPSDQHAGSRRGVDDDAGHGEPAVKQVLRDGATERVSDQDWRLGQRADEAIVVIDELVDTDPGESWVRGRTQFGRRAVVEWPGRGDDGVAPGFVVGLEAFPALGVQPGVIDQHDGFGHGLSVGSAW